MSAFGIDTRPLFFSRAGIASYIRNLVSGLYRVAPDNRYVLLCPTRGTSLAPRVEVPETAWRALRLPLRNRLFKGVWENLLVPLTVCADRLDLVHFPRFAVPRIRASRTLVTIHDLAFYRCPDTLTPRGQRYFAQATAQAVRRADAVIAVSNQTRQDLLDIYPISPDRVHVVYNGVESRFCPGDPASARERIRRTYGVEGGYILFLGTLEPRKNVVGLLNAYALLRETGAGDLPLVLAGRKGWLYERIFQAVEDLNLASHVHFLNHVPHADLPDLYRAAQVFAYPSFYEGFGIPVVDALACGVPVVTSNTSSLPEVTGDAALLVDPNDPEAIADALRRLIEDRALADALRQRGPRQAARFSWDRAAGETLDIYRRTID